MGNRMPRGEREEWLAGPRDGGVGPEGIKIQDLVVQ